MTAASTGRYVLPISSERRITIPKDFYQKLGFGREAECVVNGGELVIRPVRTEDFSEQILADLVEEGYSGRELLEEFRRRYTQVRPAVEAMIAGSDAIAAGRAPYETFDDVFGADGD